MQKRFAPDAGGVFPEWEEVRLGDIVELKNGYAFSAKTYDKKHDGKYNVLTIANVQSEKFVKIDNKTNTISELPKNIREHQKLKDGDLLISLTGNVGRVAINKGQNNLLNQRVGKLEIKDAEKVDSTFLYYVLNSDLFLKSMKCKGHGTAQKNLSKPDVEEFLFYMPCIEEQRKIAAALAAYDEMIAVKTAKLETWQECKKRMVKEIFGRAKRFRDDDGNEFPEWEEKTLGEVTEYVRNGYSYKPDGLRTHKYKVTRIETISTGKINPEKLGSCDECDEKYLLKSGDILYSNINSLSYLGNTAIYKNSTEKIYHGMNLLCIRPKSSVIDADYLFAFLNSEAARKFVKYNAQRAVNQCSIKVSDVRNMKIPLPCMTEQQKIGSFLAEIDKEIEIQKEFVRTYAEGKRRMMMELMA